jgi:hypothetical protein
MPNFQMNKISEVNQNFHLLIIYFQEVNRNLIKNY